MSSSEKILVKTSSGLVCLVIDQFPSRTLPAISSSHEASAMTVDSSFTVLDSLLSPFHGCSFSVVFNSLPCSSDRRILARISKT